MTTTALRDPTAVVGRRVVAVIIDVLLLGIPSFFLITNELEYIDKADFLAQGFTEADYDDACDVFDSSTTLCIVAGDSIYIGRDISPLPSLAGLAASLGMYVVLQGLVGWTVGKLIMGIRTVKEDGTAPGIGKALIRWLLLIVDTFPYCAPLVGFICALSTKGHRRVGDMAAKTFVVSKADMGSPIMVAGMNAPAMAMAGAAYGEGSGWGTGAPPPPGAGWAAPQQPTGWDQPAATPPPAPSSWPPESTGDATMATPVAGGDEPPSGVTGDAPVPQWDEARGTYIQWDAERSTWLQWDETSRTWSPIPGQ